jgi:hypothetical protein
MPQSKDTELTEIDVAERDPEATAVEQADDKREPGQAESKSILGVSLQKFRKSQQPTNRGLAIHQSCCAREFWIHSASIMGRLSALLPICPLERRARVARLREHNRGPWLDRHRGISR